jgi:hypothetical protein
LRKYLIVAFAAMTALAFAATSFGAAPAATMKVKVAPTKAGTKKKPKNSSIHLTIKNNDSKKTLSQLVVTSPKTFKLSTKGFPACDENTLANSGPTACPKASKLGKGTANALLGVNGTSPSPLHFDVTAVVTGKNKVGFHLHSEQVGDLVSPATIKGRKLTINVPPAAQQPLPGTWAGLVDIDTTLKAKKGKNFFASTNGCKKKKHAFSTKLIFVDNGTGADPSPITVKGSSKCK